MYVQTRNNAGELRYFDTVSGAMDFAAKEDTTIWKISFSYNGERVRLFKSTHVQPKAKPVRITVVWTYSNIDSPADERDQVSANTYRDEHS